MCLLFCCLVRFVLVFSFAFHQFGLVFGTRHHAEVRDDIVALLDVDDLDALSDAVLVDRDLVGMEADSCAALVDDHQVVFVLDDGDGNERLLLEIKGEFPVQGERIEYKRFTFDVLEVDQRRIVKVKVIVHND